MQFLHHRHYNSHFESKPRFQQAITINCIIIFLRRIVHLPTRNWFDFWKDSRFRRHNRLTKFKKSWKNLCVIFRSGILRGKTMDFLNFSKLKLNIKSQKRIGQYI